MIIRLIIEVLGVNSEDIKLIYYSLLYVLFFDKITEYLHLNFI